MNMEAQQEPGSTVPGSPSELGSRVAEAVGRFRSQREAAEAAGVSLSQLKRYIAGTSEPGVGAMAALARAANISLDWLINGPGSSQDQAAVIAMKIQTDHRLIGRLTERIMLAHKEMGVGLALHQAAERAAREHDRIVMAVADPDDRLIAIGEVVERLRQELREAAAAPATSKHRA